MSLTGVDIAPGAIVTITGEASGQNWIRYNTNQRYTLIAGEELEVTRVYNDTLLVRTVRTKEVEEYGWSGNTIRHKRVSFQIGRGALDLVDENYVAPPPPPAPRRLGTPPEGEDTIPIDHPGIQWLFKDMAKFAEGKRWCGEYDLLCAELGLPGRERDFNIALTVGGMTFHTTARGHNMAEARAKAEAALAARMSGFTPAA